MDLTYLKTLLGFVSNRTQRYNNGERSDEFIEEYIDVLAEANDKEMLTKLVPQYLDNKYEKMLTDRKLFNFFMSYIESPYSKPYVFFLENKDKFTEQYGEMYVNMKERYTWNL